MVKVLTRVTMDAAFIAWLLFASAGTLYWPRAWALLAALLLVRLVTVFTVYRVNSELLRERAGPPVHRDQPTVDKVLVTGVLLAGFVLIPVVAGLDVFRWQLLPAPPSALANLGIVLFILGWMLKAVVLRTNSFATAAVRLQSGRAHAVIDTGVYGVVRHPFYAGTLLVFIGMSLWLESLAALAYCIVPGTLVVIRTVLEERFLRSSLPGYIDYAVRVRHRLIPGVW